MICYADTTFCSKSEQCKPEKPCRDQITPEHKKRAERIGLPFAVADFSERCGRFKEREKCD